MSEPRLLAHSETLSKKLTIPHESPYPRSYRYVPPRWPDQNLIPHVGFVALPVAQAFSRAGHIVYGVTRSQSSADRLLAPEEIIPVVCDSSTDEGRKVWGAIAATCDVGELVYLSDMLSSSPLQPAVIDTVPAYGPEVPRKSYEHVVSLAKSRERGAKLTYIFTGGLWSLSAGPGGLDKWTDERQPDSGQIKLTAWRKEVQDDILSSTSITSRSMHPG